MKKSVFNSRSVVALTFATALTMAATLSLTGCGTAEHTSEDAKKILKLDDLTQEMAKSRRQKVSYVKYQLFVDVSAPGDTFSGEQKISFDLQKPEDVWVDFQEGNILKTTINGKVIKAERGPNFIRLPQENLIKGTNSVTFAFNHKYSRVGTGLHRFQDPEDKKVYLYTDFEPYDASRWAPFFDQPDMKATLELTVKAPLSWVLSANTRETKIDKTAKAATWYFPKTQTLSTYLFALMAGPYVVWEDSYENVPLRLMARKAMAKYVQPKDWFKITKQGFAFYEKYFNIKYPFGKYDQIIVPEFNSGAMENAGAVTFSERYLKRGRYSRNDRFAMASVLLHEMAHMWFGDLVTMRWWNDLWLNESFATYMASMALNEATVFSESWTDFRIDKTAAYILDQTIATHSISSVVRNTDEALSNLDAITYNKGASVMKELGAYVGDDVFKESIRSYFQKHAYENTTLNDFIAAFERTLQTNMKPWFEASLETTGVDTVQQSFTCTPLKNGKTQVAVALNLSKGARPHALKVAGYKLHAGNEVLRSFELAFKTNGETSAQAVAETDGCPDFIYSNYQDHAYVKVALDEASLKFITNNIDNIKSPLLRVSLWADMWEMVRDQRMKLAQFAEMALKTLAVEQDIMVLGYVLQKSVGAGFGDFDSVTYYWPKTFEQDRIVFKQLAINFENVIYARLKEAKKKSAEFEDEKIKLVKKTKDTSLSQNKENIYEDQYELFFDMYLATLDSSRSVTNAAAFLKETKDLDQRWTVLLALCRENYSKVEQLLTKELKADKSDNAIKSALSCRVLRPVAEQKKAYVKNVTGEKISYSNDELGRVARNLFPPKQRDSMIHYRAEIYQAMKTIWPKHEGPISSRLTANLAPLNCGSEMNKEMKAFLDSSEAQKLPASMRKQLNIRFDADQRCVAIRQYNKD